MDDNDMSVTDAALPSASLACSSTTWSYAACTFYTTFTPAFHSSEPTDTKKRTFYYQLLVTLLDMAHSTMLRLGLRSWEGS